MNKRMILFAKIMSIIVILNFIFSQFDSTGKSTFSLSSLIGFILLILFTFPLFYYAFYEIKSKKIKLWAKIITFVYLPVIFLTFYFLGNFEGIENLVLSLVGILIHILTLIVIYYYAWIDKD